MIKQDQWKVLLIGALTEFGERYSYYIIQSLLIFFLIEHFKIPESRSQVLVGTVISAFYISSLLGGYISDKILNHYLSALLGALLMTAGNSILALTSTEHGLFMGLAVISISTGLIKSNIATFIGEYYDKSGFPESQRDFGFNIFYIGINLGIFCAFFVATGLKNTYGYDAPFYSSIMMCIVMVLNLALGLYILRNYITFAGVVTLNKLLKLSAILIVYIIGIFFLLKYSTIANTAVALATCICLFIMYKSAQGKYWRNVFVALIFFILSIIYWSIYFQLYISILLFLDKTVAHSFLNITINSTQFLSILSIWLLIFGVIMGKIWISFEKKSKPVHDIDKFSLGLFLLAVSMLLLYFGIKFTPLDIKLPAIIILGVILVVAISELSLSAIGLSMVTKIAPNGYVALYMGIWLVTLGIGGKFAGVIASKIDISNNIAQSKINMSNGLIEFTAIALGGVFIALIFRKFIKNSNLT